MINIAQPFYFSKRQKENSDEAPGTYASNGNVLTLQDYKSGNPQTQTFTYNERSML